MVLQREAPQADLNTNSGFDVPALTVRTACEPRMAIVSTGCECRVTFEAVDVRYPILSVPKLVDNGHRVVFRGHEAEFRTAGGAVVPLTRMREVWVNNSKEFLLVDSGASCDVWPMA